MRGKPDQGVELFQREHWSRDIQETSIKLRLLCRPAWVGVSFTEAEVAALRTIAAGGEVEGGELEARIATNLLNDPRARS